MTAAVGRTVTTAAAKPGWLHISERQFMGALTDYARLMGWHVYHTHDSRHSEAGYPDLTLVRERIVWAELKAERGRVTEAQREWQRAITGAGGEFYIWRPSSFAHVEIVLARVLS